MGSCPHRVLTRLQQPRADGQPTPVVIFDLDSTLIDTSPRHHAILQAFVAEREPSLRQVVDGMAAERIGWSAEPLLSARGAAPDVVSRFHAFWAERFFTGPWCLHDEAAPGAVTFVRRVVELGALAYYLTARPSPTMGAQTVQRLQQLGFPVLRGRCPLHMKPAVAMSDARFKRSALREAASLGEVVATFENEPGHANALREAYPEAHHYLVGDVHSPDAPVPHPGIHQVADFHARS